MIKNRTHYKILILANLKVLSKASSSYFNKLITNKAKIKLKNSNKNRKYLGIIRLLDQNCIVYMLQIHWLTKNHILVYFIYFLLI